MIIGHFAVKNAAVVPLEFIGIQKFGEKSFELFNIKKPLSNFFEGFDHPVNSTLTRNTLESYGYRIV